MLIPIMRPWGIWAFVLKDVCICNVIMIFQLWVYFWLSFSEYSICTACEVLWGFLHAPSTAASVAFVYSVPASMGEGSVVIPWLIIATRNILAGKYFHKLIRWLIARLQKLQCVTAVLHWAIEEIFLHVKYIHMFIKRYIKYRSVAPLLINVKQCATNSQQATATIICIIIGSGDGSVIVERQAITSKPNDSQFNPW